MSSKVSVVMPCYNAEKYISEAIDSILHQTYSNWELIIVDDASTDRSAELIQAYVRRDLRISAYVNQEKRERARPEIWRLATALVSMSLF